MRNRCTASPHRRPLGIGNRGWCVCWWSDLRVAAGVALNMGGRFFGPATPFAAIAALVLSLVMYAFLWGLGLLVNASLLIVGAMLTLAPGRTRQVGTGIVVGFLVFGVCIGVVFSSV